MLFKMDADKLRRRRIESSLWKRMFEVVLDIQKVRRLPKNCNGTHNLVQQSQSILETDMSRKFCENLQLDECRGTEYVIALLAVSVISNAKRGREQTERQHGERNSWRAQRRSFFSC